MTPDQINATWPAPVYRCRCCRIETGLHWYRGTSCPVCSKEACIAFCNSEWQQAYDDALDQEFT